MKFKNILAELKSEVVGKAATKKVIIKDESGKVVDTFASNADAYKKYRVLPKGYSKQEVSE